MRRNPLSLPSELILDQFLSYGREAPEGVEALPVPVLIRMLRNTLRMTQAQLARRAGLPQSHLAVIETGKVDLKLATLRKIIKALQGELVIAVRFRKMPASIVAERVKEVAGRKVARIAGAIVLEKQLPESKTIRALVRSEEKRLMDRPSAELWDESRVSDGSSLARDRARTRSERMPVRVVEAEEDRDALRFWIAQPPEARINAMEFLRRQMAMVSGKRSIPRIKHEVRMRELRA